MNKNNELTKQHRELISITLIFCSINRLFIGLWNNQILLALSCTFLLFLSVILQNLLVFRELGWIHLAEAYSRKKRYEATVMGQFFPHHYHIKTFNKLTNFDIKSILKIILAIFFVGIYIIKYPIDIYTALQAMIFLSIFTIRMNFYPLIISWLHIITSSYAKFGGNSKLFLCFIIFVAWQGIFFSCLIAKKEQNLKLGRINKTTNWNDIWLEKAIIFSMIFLCIFMLLPENKIKKENHSKINIPENNSHSDTQIISQADEEMINGNIQASAKLLNMKNSIERNESKRNIHKKIDQISESDVKQISINLDQRPKNKAHAQDIMKNELKYNKKNLVKAIHKQHQKHQKKIAQTLEKSKQIRNLQNISDLRLNPSGDKDVTSGSSGGSGSSTNGLVDNHFRQDLPKSLDRKINKSLSLSQLANQMENKEDRSKIKETLGNFDKSTLKNIQSEMGIRSGSNNQNESIDKITQKYQNNPTNSAQNIHNLAEKEIRTLDKKIIHEINIDTSKKPELFKNLKPLNLSTSILISIIILMTIFIFLFITSKVKNKDAHGKNFKHLKKQAKKNYWIIVSI
ncbi:MAG: hypothetical protein AB8G05_09610 [Oligoflexales bacterium]